MKILNEEESSHNEEEDNMDEGDFGDYINIESSMISSPKVAQKKRSPVNKSKESDFDRNIENHNVERLLTE